MVEEVVQVSVQGRHISAFLIYFHVRDNAFFEEDSGSDGLAEVLNAGEVVAVAG